MPLHQERKAGLKLKEENKERERLRRLRLDIFFYHLPEPDFWSIQDEDELI